MADKVPTLTKLIFPVYICPSLPPPHPYCLAQNQKRGQAYDFHFPEPFLPAPTDPTPQPKISPLPFSQLTTFGIHPRGIPISQALSSVAEQGLREVLGSHEAGRGAQQWRRNFRSRKILHVCTPSPEACGGQASSGSSRMSASEADGLAGPEQAAYHLYIYPQLSAESQDSCRVTATKDTTTSDVIRDAIATLRLDGSKRYVLVEVKESGGEEWVLDANDSPVHRVLLWPRRAQDEHPRCDGYYFLLQERNADGTIKYLHMQLLAQATDRVAAAQKLVRRGFLPWQQADFDDLCDLPELTEANLLRNLKRRFLQQKIYTYAGSILVAINPFKFLPIYNPKYVKMYENQQLGRLEPHIFAIADAAYHAMLRKRLNQCIVISGESGSGKTQSTNFLIHCLTALSQKGYASGVERTILGAGPVLEAFGNAKTAHNNNSSRFGKFIQVNYLESGIVRGAIVEKYLLEKSRLVSQEKDERNYHVFYYLLLGVSEEERQEFQLRQPEDYFYLNQHNLKIEDAEDLKHDFERLKQAMEMVGFLPATKKQIFSVLSAILYLGNVTYKKRPTGRDEGLEVGPPEVLDTLSHLLKVKREILVEVLTKRKTVTVNDKLILPYSFNEAITARDSMAKSLYSALFDWIVLRINHALLNKKDMEESVSCLSIGVLDIFGFEDFERNSFEQFCINYANEQLQYYFNQHIFKLEQEEYQSEGITWHNIDYTDNVGCIHLISRKPTGLFYLLDEESSFPHATSQTLLAKFKQQHEDNKYFLGTPVLEPAFIIQHFAGRVKYQIKDFREKNMDYMRPDIVALLRGSDSSYVRELIGMDPVAVFRWAVLRAAVRAMAVLREAGRLRAERIEKAAGTGSSGIRNHPGEPQRAASTPSEKLYRDLHDQIIKSIKGLPWQGEDPRRLLQSLSRLQKSRAFIPKSKGIKQKQIIPKNLLDSKSLKLIISMTLHDRTTKSLLHLHKKKKPPSISAQFQASLNKLLEALGKAEPFFIRCVRSNAEKKELFFDEELVLQQLRYTGMLETVRIRRSGYSAKYTFQDFTEQFQVLLAKNAPPCREVISTLLEKMAVDKKNYQIGKTKVFLKELERQALQETLHREVVRKILLLQSWFRMVLERRHFLQMKQATVTIQACWRSYRVRRELERTQAAMFLQAMWRGYRQRTAYQHRRQSIIRLQSLCRGHLQRKSFSQMVSEKRKAEEEERETQVTTGEAMMETTGEQMPTQTVSEAPSSLDVSEPQPSDESPTASSLPETETPVVEKPTPSQKLSAESHEKAPSSREKRESRRQRGLEHVKFQNKHMQSYKEEGVLRDAYGRAGPELEENLLEDQKENREEGTSLNTELEVKCSSPSKQPVEVLPATTASETSGNAQEGSPRPSRTERPTSLTLDSRTSVPETLKDRSRSSTSSRDRPESPGSSAQIQRYRDTDSERLAIAVEIWRGKKFMAAAPCSMLSQSLDLSEPYRPALTPTEERQISLSTSDVSRLLCPPRTQSSTESVDGDPSSKKPLVQKKKSSDLGCVTDLGLSPGLQVDSKSAFKRLFGPKNKDKKYSLEGVEEVENTGSGHAGLEAATTKKNLEALSSHQHRHPTGEKPTKEPGGKGKKNRNLKIGKITISEKWRESVFRNITNVNELKYLDEFLLKKVNDLRSQKTPTESLFIEATEKFRSNLKTMYSVPNGKIHVGYKDLMENYQIVVTNLAAERGEKDTNLVLNLFQLLLDEFTRKHSKSDFENPKQSKSQKKKRKQERAVQQHNGHVFSSYQVSIPQSCEHCLSYIWLMDKALLCSVCKMTCHKKCVHKIQTYCSYTCGQKVEPGAEPGHFGVCVDSLTSDKASVPIVLEKLLEHVEMHGLYTEGLYRKSGTANRQRELRQALQTDPTAVKLENYPIHAITGVLKQWLRELPEPLMTFAQYNDFLHAVELPERLEQLTAIYAVLDHLPEANHNSLERLIFHLVKVALLEDVNRMSPSALAIIFAPCLLRCPDTSDPLTSVKDVLKITTCVEMLIKEQMRKYKVKMEEINQLEAAESIAFRRLSLLRQNTPWLLKLGFSSPYEGVLNKSPKARASSGGLEELGVLPEEVAAVAADDEDREKEILMERIQSIKEEKQDITYRLPELDPRGSDEENLDSETSASTESLLEEWAGRGASEGPPVPGVPHPGTPTPSPLPVVAEVAAPPRRRPSSFVTVRVKTPRRTPVMPMANIKLPPGLPAHLCGWAPQTHESGVPVRRREPPARRPDLVHSVYVAPGAELPMQAALETLDEEKQPPSAKRRYSDPPTYCLPRAPDQANG
ncbi:PREDICTED: unconventional myosin-IXb [Chrysochloris asiatica]|uniref:Unconventional myosin-IXb n=1 Tax=Chrysochloris asiatica TaxID=185453 RepID=A0A9B0UDF0_CHRAS|nr:PREDICTED: unconventional myosin-IXb [Chrysochloris asiatica]